MIIKGPGNEDDDYPRILFNNRDKVSSFQDVAILSVFRFRYNPAPYKVEFTIRRQWPDARSISTTEPKTTYGITVYGEDWDKEVVASEYSRSKQGWGQELEHLFEDDEGYTQDGRDGSGGRKAVERVRTFVEAMQGIRDALSI